MGASLSVGHRKIDDSLVDVLLSWPPRDVQEVQALVEGANGANVNATALREQLQDRDHIPALPSDSMLHLAARAWASESVRYLLDKGANIAYVNQTGDTPLHAACGTELYEYQEFIHPDTGEPVTGIEPLTDPKYGVAAVEVLNLFHGKGAAINAANKAGDTPLHLAARSRFSHVLVPALLNNGADPLLKNELGETALHLACRNIYGAEAATILLVKGAEPDAITTTGNTPLHYTCPAGAYARKAQMLALLKRQVDVNVQNNDGNTVLHLASTCPKNFDTIVPLLIENGADKLLPNKANKTPGMVAEESTSATKRGPQVAAPNGVGDIHKEINQYITKTA